MDITLTESQTAVLEAEDAKQRLAMSFALDDPSAEAATAYAAAAQGTPGMDEICVLQESISSDSCLRFPDETVARYGCSPSRTEP